MKPDEMFYGVQKAFIRKGNEVLVLNDPKEGLDFPGGKIQQGEKDLAESLKREVLEETGLQIEVGRPFATWLEDFPKGHKLEGNIAFIVAYACEYLSGDVVISHEHDNFTWVTKENYKSVDDKTSYFRILEKYFNL